MAARGLSGISQSWLDEEALISDFWAFGRDFVGAYVLGARQKAIRRYQWSSLYIWDALSMVRTKNVGQLDRLRAMEPYKLPRTYKMVSNYRLILSRYRMVWMPCAGYRALCYRVRRYASAESAAQRVKYATDAYRGWRRRAARYTKKGTHI
jgi:hypothetical protein